MNEDLNKLIDILNNEKTVCLLAPSFVIDFPYPNIILQLRKLGFTKVVELTFAAKLISSEYHEVVKNTKKPIICANCPSIVKLIENKYPQLKDNLADICSPMVLMGRFAKTSFGNNYKTVFIGPCITKKIEARENSKDIDYAITFKELEQLLTHYSENNLFKDVNETKKNLDFDKFYNDYTKIYPLSGAVAKTMHSKEILKENEILIGDGIIEIEKAINIVLENNKKVKFLDLLFCNGGCCGGPGIVSTKSKDTKIKKVLNYREISRKHKIGKNKGLIKHEKELDLNLKRK